MQDWDSDQIKRHAVRLFPTIRISSEKEAELRATAALCAMIRAVSEFGRAVVRMAGGPAGKLECYTEVEFKIQDADEKALRPDAIIRVVRGKTEWKAMVEVKVGDSKLRAEQLADYQVLVRQEQFDALITISNEAALPNGLPPVTLDKRRLRTAPVFHLSWDRLLSEAQLLSRKKGIDDEDQQWMLGEWIKYVADPSSKIIAAATLGDDWNVVLRSAREGNLSAAAKQLAQTVELWDAYMRKVGLRLRAELKVDVDRRVARADKHDPAGRIKRLLSKALETGCLEGDLRIPDAVGDVSLSVNLQSKVVRYSVEVKAPTEGRAPTRINWLLRQLKAETAPRDLKVTVEWDQRRLCSRSELPEALADVTCLMRDHSRQPIPKDALPKRFVLEWTVGLQKGRGRSTAPVLDGISKSLERFYRDVVEGLVPFVPKAPRLRRAKGEDDTIQEPNPGEAVGGDSAAEPTS
jgi:hypothetical protein